MLKGDATSLSKLTASLLDFTCEVRTMNKVSLGVNQYRSKTTNDVVKLRKKLVSGIGNDMSKMGRLMK